jgi:hypothetical protein
MDTGGDMATVTPSITAPLSPEHHDQPKPTTETVAGASAKPANALTPPTSEEMNHDIKDEESELSDLDLSDDEDDEDDIGEIEPITTGMEATFRFLSQQWCSSRASRSLSRRWINME